MKIIFVPHWKHTYGSPQPVTGTVLLVYYVDDICTSHVPHERASAACYSDSFSFLHVYDVRTSQETHRVKTASYGDSLLTFETLLYQFDSIKRSDGTN
jgi:hypothetical protein